MLRISMQILAYFPVESLTTLLESSRSLYSRNQLVQILVQIVMESLKDSELSNLAKFLTCFRNADNQITINLINTNKPKS